MTTEPTYIVITPVRDEAPHIQETLDSLANQTRLPIEWIIVNDGSRDGTDAIVDRFALEHPWVRVVHRADRGFRANGGGVMDAFHAGLECVRTARWDFLVKLDGDLSFAPDYFASCLERFATDPELGIGGGTVYANSHGTPRIDSVGDPQFHVRGATKIYRRACWEQIAPLAKAPGWDTLDEVKANYFGWRTSTFPDLKILQNKPTGGADGPWSNALKNGKANYLTGYSPLFMLAKCAKRLLRKPYLIEASGLASGFLSGYLKRMPRAADAKTIRYLRQQQLRRLLMRPSIYG